MQHEKSGAAHASKQGRWNLCVSIGPPHAILRFIGMVTIGQRVMAGLDRPLPPCLREDNTPHCHTEHARIACHAEFLWHRGA